MDFDFKNMQTYHYFVFGGSALAILAAVLYFVTGGKRKVSAFIGIGLSCLAIGFGAGVLALGRFGYNWTEKPAESAPTEQAQLPAPGPDGEMPKGGMPKGMGAMPKGMGAMPKGMGGMPKGMGGGGGRGPNPKTQLVSLITKLNQLTEKPLSISLSEDRKKKVAEQIKNLEGLETLTDDEAKKRLEALLDVVKEDRASMEAAGYNWPGSGQGGFGGKSKDEPNPFKTERNNKNLKALQERVSAK